MLPLEVSLAIIVGAFVFFWWFRSKSRSDAPPLKLTPVKPIDNSAEAPKKVVAPAKVEMYSDNTLRVYYGSQTGTAEEFSKTFAGEAEGYGFVSKVFDLEDFKEEDIHRGGSLIFFVATYGDGEPTDNAKTFYDWIMDDNETGAVNGDLPFKGVKYGVFGLGNKTYQHFNAIGIKLFKKLKELGGEPMYELGTGDDDVNIEEDFNKWKAGFWRAAAPSFLTASSGEITAEAKHKPKWKLIYLNQAPTAKEGTGYDPKSPKECTLVVNRELHTVKSDRSCRHIEIDLGDLRYEAGDHLGIFPENDSDLVNSLAARLSVTAEDLSKYIVMKSQEGRVELGPCSIHQALTNLADITALPRKSLLKILSVYTENPDEKKKLEVLAGEDDPSNALNYNSFIKEDYRSIAELFIYDFPSIKMDIATFLEIAPRIQPRLYSISSSPAAHGNLVSVTAVVTLFEKSTKRVHKGVCTTWLKERQASKDKIPVFVRQSKFKLPQDPSVPILMIGPGTGLAPFRGFIHERKHNAKRTPTPGENILFFGCRHPDIDYIYKEELEEQQNSKHIDLHVAFSRLQNEKVYVQHLLLKNKDRIAKLIKEHNLAIYVCGEAKAMAKDVNRALISILVDTGMTESQAEAHLKHLGDIGRYAQDVW